MESRTEDKQSLRSLVEQNFKIKKVKQIAPKETGFLAADSSTATRDLRFHALWSIHCVSTYGLFNGRENEDPLVGNGYTPYTSLMYDSSVDVGSFDLYHMLEQQLNHIRIGKEYEELAVQSEKMAESGFNLDFILVDGSLKTNSENLSAKQGFDGLGNALQAQDRLLKKGRVVSMVEDSHASDIARRLRLKMSNLMLFDIALDECEYVVDEGVFNVCYIKQPSKRISYLDGNNWPLTVRWEFSYRNFDEDLERLCSIWANENDLLHPQVYPLRTADYLTRRLKASGLLDEAIAEANPEVEFRNMRESVFE